MPLNIQNRAFVKIKLKNICIIALSFSLTTSIVLGTIHNLSALLSITYLIVLVKKIDYVQMTYSENILGYST
jgi:hypothetical protein